MASDRKANLAADKKTREKLEKLYKAVEKGFNDQAPRASEIKDNWAMYRCELGPKQLFYGRNQLFAPLVYDALRARATRFTNQLFPQNGRHIECISSDGSLPRAELAICEHHIDHSRLRELVPALCIAGDVEGQYNVYVEWQDSKRYTTRRVKKPVEADGLEVGKADDIEEEVVSTGGPLVELIPDADVCILPATAATTDEAVTQGGSVTILRRWNKAKVQELIDDDTIDEKAGEALLDNMFKMENGNITDTEKEAAKAAGVKKDGRGEWTLVFETWTNIKIKTGKKTEKGEDKREERLCRIYFGGPAGGATNILSAVRNPLWCDKIPLRSVPVQRQPGSAKGQAPVSFVADLQYYANDVLNEAADACNYALLPILKRDPENATAPLVLAPGAIWDVPPNSVDIVKFPDVWKEAFQILSDLEAKILQTLSVNPSMITQGISKAKKNQAEIAQQQQVDVLTTADAATTIETGILTWLAEFFLDLDYQFRDEKMLVQQYGPLGQNAIMEMIPPLQNDTRFVTRWFGIEVTRSAQQIQQKIAMLGVFRGMPPASYPDYMLDVQPIMLDLVESTCGPQQGRLVFKDQRSQVSADPKVENTMMDEGLFVDVHPMDNDIEHIQVHEFDLKTNGDPSGLKMLHLQKHSKQAMVKQAAQKIALGGGAGGGKGGAGQPAAAGAGRPNQTPPGAQPRGPQGMQKPAGMIPQDSLQDPSVMPRKAG